MNDSLRKFNLNEIDTFESGDENINLKTIIIPGFEDEQHLHDFQNNIASIENRTAAINHNTVIESADDIFIFSKPEHITKNPVHSGLTQIPTTFKSGKKNITADKNKDNIFLKNAEQSTTQLKQKTSADVLRSKNPVSLNQKNKQRYHSQKSYSLTIILLFALILACTLFVLHLNNSIDLHKITFDIVETGKNLLSHNNLNSLINDTNSFSQAKN